MVAATPVVSRIDVGVACHVANKTTCGRLGIAVWTSHGVKGIEATLGGKTVRLQPGPYWEGFVTVDPHWLKLPAYWLGDQPVRDVSVRFAIRTATGVVVRTIRTQLRPGWG